MPSEAIKSDFYLPAPTQLTFSIQLLPPKFHKSSQKKPNKEIINAKKCLLVSCQNRKIKNKLHSALVNSNIKKIHKIDSKIDHLFRMCPDRGPRSLANCSDLTSGRVTPLMKPRPCHNAEQDVPVLEIIDSGSIISAEWI